MIPGEGRTTEGWRTKNNGTRALPFFLVAVLIGGCASGGRSSGSNLQRDPERISEAELQSLPTGTAWDAIRRLRPNWLRSRSATIAGGSGGFPPRVFVDERDFGTIDSLRSLNLDSVAEIEFMSGRDATTRYGTGYVGGIIHVHLKRIS